jgi:hypothetical protein
MALTIGPARALETLLDEAFQPGASSWTQIDLTDTTVSATPNMRLNLSSPREPQLYAGDCFVFTFAAIEHYKEKAEELGLDDPFALYAPVPGDGETDLAECSLAPAATCTRLGPGVFRIRLTGDGIATATLDGTTHVTGTVGPFQNPFSEVDLVLDTVDLMRGDDCDENVISHAKVGVPKARIERAAVTVAGGTFAVSNEPDPIETWQEGKASVGALAQATFSFSPGPVLSEWGGVVSLEAPAWYSFEDRRGRQQEEQAFGAATF